jgi:hypothetical protein
VKRLNKKILKSQSVTEPCGIPDYENLPPKPDPKACGNERFTTIGLTRVGFLNRVACKNVCSASRSILALDFGLRGARGLDFVGSGGVESDGLFGRICLIFGFYCSAMAQF